MFSVIFFKAKYILQQSLLFLFKNDIMLVFILISNIKVILLIRTQNKYNCSPLRIEQTLFYHCR